MNEHFEVKTIDFRKGILLAVASLGSLSTQKIYVFNSFQVKDIFA